MSSLDELRLLVITDLDRFGEAHTLAVWDALAGAARPGALALDLREATRSARALLEVGGRLAEVARRHQQRFVVNDRLDLAHALGAEGVHFKENSVPTARARPLLGARFVVRACHRAEDAADVDADIVLLSPILEARKGNPALGVSAVTDAAQRLAARTPPGRLFALGGIDAENAELCLRAGAQGVAAISSVFASENPARMLGVLGVCR